MKTHTYLQIKPNISSTGKVTSVSVVKATSTRPTQPMPGATVIKLEFEFSETLFEIPVLRHRLEQQGTPVSIVGRPIQKGIEDMT